MGQAYGEMAAETRHVTLLNAESLLGKVAILSFTEIDLIRNHGHPLMQIFNRRRLPFCLQASFRIVPIGQSFR